jgi:hypothetical protein
MRDFERKALLVRLEKAGWAIDPEQTRVVRAHRILSAAFPWPFGMDPALPWPQREVLVAGWLAQWNDLDCKPETDGWHEQGMGVDGLVPSSHLAEVLHREGALAVSLERTHTENSPGLSIMARAGLLDPRALVEGYRLVAVHQGIDARRAWSYGRSD